MAARPESDGRAPTRTGLKIADKPGDDRFGRIDDRRERCRLRQRWQIASTPIETDPIEPLSSNAPIAKGNLSDYFRLYAYVSFIRNSSFLWIFDIGTIGEN